MPNVARFNCLWYLAIMFKWPKEHIANSSHETHELEETFQMRPSNRSKKHIFYIPKWNVDRDELDGAIRET